MTGNDTISQKKKGPQLLNARGLTGVEKEVLRALPVFAEQGCSQLSLTAVLGEFDTLCWPSQVLHAQGAHAYMQGNTHTHKSGRERDRNCCTEVLVVFLFNSYRFFES